MNKIIKNNKTLIKESGIYFVGKVVPGLLLFFSIPLIIRLYGEEVYGEYSLIVTALLMLNTLLTGWINQSFMRFSTAKKDPVYFQQSMLRLLLVCNFIILLVGDVVLIILEYSWSRILLFDIFLISLSLFSFSSTVSQTKFKVVRTVIADTIRVGTFIACILLLYVFINRSMNFAIISLLISGVCGYMLGSIFLKGNIIRLSELIRLFKSKLSKVELKEVVQYGAPIAFWMVAANLLNLSDRYIIKHYIDFQAVGEYSAVYDTFSKLMTFTFGPILLALQPRVIKLFNEGAESKSYKLIKQIVLLELTAFFVALIVVFQLKEFIISDFLELENPYLQSLVIPIFIGAFLWTISLLIQKPLELRKKTMLMMWAVIIALAANVIGNIVFIPKYGIIAAAYTTIVGSFLYLIVILLLQARTKGVQNSMNEPVPKNRKS